MVSSDANWHLRRRKRIERQHGTDIGKLRGVIPTESIICIVALVGVQWGIWAFVTRFLLLSRPLHVVIIGVLSWINSNTFLYMLGTFIHENSHGLVLGASTGRKVLTALFIELGLCSFGEQWEYTHVHYVMHHPHLNSDKDSECPVMGHVAYVPGGWRRIAFPLIELIPLGVLLTTGNLSNNVQRVAIPIVPRIIIAMTSILVYMTLSYFKMWPAILLSAWSVSFFSSRWCISLHGQSIAEHYKHDHRPQSSNAPTRSTYFWLENVLGFNTGYHDEHHTFPDIAWCNLPVVRRTCPDVFNNSQPKRYFELWWEWCSHGFDTEYFRVCHSR